MHLDVVEDIINEAFNNESFCGGCVFRAPGGLVAGCAGCMRYDDDPRAYYGAPIVAYYGERCAYRITDDEILNKTSDMELNNLRKLCGRCEYSAGVGGCPQVCRYHSQSALRYGAAVGAAAKSGECPTFRRRE